MVKLVTGGAGYLGSHLAKKLLKQGERVRVLDIARTKYLPPEVEFVEGDIRDRRVVAKAMEDADVVFHLAFIQSFSRRPEREKWEIDIGGTRHMLEAALEVGVRRFVHTSTIEIYGTRPPFPCTEDAPTDDPVGWYGRHKLETEWLCGLFMKQGLAVTMLRLPTICGPGHYNHGPMLDLMDRILAGKPVAVAGDGKIYGSFVGYEDALDAYCLAAAKGEAVGEAFNVAAAEPATHREVLQAMIEAVGSRSTIVGIPRFLVGPALRVLRAAGLWSLPDYQTGYILNHNCYAIDKAKRLLGFSPKWSTAQAAAELIKSYAVDRHYVRQRNRNY
ncbi:MAG: NAD(P)-dependent oxidoreductase [Elusimicrobia bacterium]|nr:NAD(P)-dependent oxidoreductase [Elusimicrobiota bacterium]